MKTWKNLISALLKKAKIRFRYLNYLFYSIIPSTKKINMPIFIIGSGSSGTSILSKILSLHKDIYSASEADEAWFIADKSTSLRNYKVKGKFHFDEADFDTNQAAKLNRIFCHVLEGSKKKRLLEKTPHNLYRVQWVKKLFPDAKFINIIRDGKDFIRSIKKRDKYEEAPGAYPGWWWRKDDYIWHVYKEDFLKNHPEYKNIVKDNFDDENRAAIQWINAMEKKNTESLDSKDCLIIKYENLIKEPDEILCKIYDFAKLVYDENPIIFARKYLKSPEYSERPRLIPEIKKIFNGYCKMYGYDILG